MSASIEERLSENEDGTIIVRLVKPTKVGRETVERASVRPMRAKDARLYIDEGGLKSVTRVMDVASALASPSGVVDELLTEEDVNAFVAAALKQVGKFHGTGARGGASSGSSAPDMDSPPQSSSS